MPKRWPLFPTLIVAAAIATMIALGIWQLGRAHWKEELLNTYAAAEGKPPVAIPDAINAPTEALLYRKSSAMCFSPHSWNAMSGRNAKGDAGIAHVVQCNLHMGAPTLPLDQRESFKAVLGWSEEIAQPKWTGGPLTGTLAPDSQDGFRLIADPPVAGLQASEAPSLDDIPNNHMAYAWQWFFFAGVAAIIYVLALRRREQN